MKIIITEAQYKVLTENTDEINKIIEKMGKVGYDNLDIEDKDILNQYSDFLNSGEKTEFKPQYDKNTNISDAKVGEEYSTVLKNKSEFSFRYDYADIIEDENIYYGEVKWDGELWIGLIATDKKDKLTEIDFVLDQDSIQMFSDDDEYAGYDKDKERRLQDELKSNIHQVKFFFQEEVIPNLTN